MKWKKLMPTYTFFNEQSGIEYDETMTIAEYDEFIEKNPHIKRVWHGKAPAMVGDHVMGAGPKTDGGFNERMSQIAAAHPNSPMADRWKTGESHKKLKTKAVVKKHQRKKPLVG